MALGYFKIQIVVGANYLIYFLNSSIKADLCWKEMKAHVGPRGKFCIYEMPKQ